MDHRAEHPSSILDIVRTRGAVLLRDRAILGMAGVFVLKAAMITMNFSLITLAARVLGPQRFGVYSILFSAVGVTGIVATFGQQILIMRSWNEYSAQGDAGLLKGALSYSAWTVSAGCAVAAIAAFFVVDSVYTLDLAVAATLYLVTYAFIQTTNHLVRTAVGVVAGDGIGNFAVFIPAITVLGLDLVNGSGSDVATVLRALSAGCILGLVVHGIVMARTIGTAFPGLASVRRHTLGRVWTARSLKLWVSTGLEASNQYLDVVIIGAMTSPQIAGAYFITTRIANIFAAASDSVNMFSTRHIPDLYFNGEHGTLARLLRSVAGLNCVVIAAGMALVLGAGYWVLLFINAGYAVYYPALILLCVGTATAAAAGPSASILMLTGHEGRYLAIIAGSVAVRVGGFVLFIPSFGIVGAVTASAVSFILMAVLLRASTRALAGLDGSILALFVRPIERPRAAG